MTLEELYKIYPLDTKEGEKARIVLFQTHWFSSIAEFDPRTAQALPQNLSHVLQKKIDDSESVLKDRLWRITEHVRWSIKKLFKELNESPRREHAFLPLRDVREMDTSSFMALSRRPGRNIREKLAGKPYLQAVRHFQSVDLPENRLLKTFVERLVELLELRAKSLGEPPDELIVLIRSWLTSDEAKFIRRWDNLPPNNTLLSHRHYRAIYDAWRWLQFIDEAITNDLQSIDSRAKTMEKWQKYSHMYADAHQLFAEIPVLFNYEKFEISPLVDPIPIHQSEGKINRISTLPVVQRPVCIDLTSTMPNYAFLTNETPKGSVSKSLSYPFPLIWQHWNSKKFSSEVDISLFDADAAYLNEDGCIISVPDLFFSKKHSTMNLDLAARAFISKIRETFTHSTFYWLLPDFLNDFELEITRRNINSCFPNAEPLPRSVAAVFESIDYGKLNDGYPVVVVDSVGGVQCATKLVAKFDENLKTRLPETHGFYWERHPSVILSRKNDNENNDPKINHPFVYDIPFVDQHGLWHAPARSQTGLFVNPNNLRANSQIGTFAYLLNISHSPVQGGIWLHTLQKQAGDIPLWRDQIPELSIKAMVNGHYQRFYLVTRGTTVNPIRGKAVRIPISDYFTLPVGKEQFPLFIGEDEEAVGFSAKLESPCLPLKKEVKCRLNMSFTYGADDPYKLVFEPLDKSMPPIRVCWEMTGEEIITDAPAPEYPRPMTWNELRNWKDCQGNEVDLLQWLLDSFERLIELIPTQNMITVTSNWKFKQSENGDGYWFAFAKTDQNEKCYCNSRSLLQKGIDDPNTVFPRGSRLSCHISKAKNGFVAVDISDSESVGALSWESKRRIISFRERSLQNRIALMWGDGRSLDDADCPSYFKNRLNELREEIIRKLPTDVINQKIRFLQACLHKDAPESCVQWIMRQVQSKKTVVDKQAIGLSLGTLSEAWQKTVFDELLERTDDSSLRVFAYAIWHEKSFVEKFSSVELKAILKKLTVMLEYISSCPRRKNDTDKTTVRNWVRATAEPLELLLGLLRTRASFDVDTKMLLQPHQKLTKELARQIERISDLVAQTKITLYSRVQLDNLPSKPAEDKTPDLLYALRLYLTGDDGANAIQITGIADGENE